MENDINNKFADRNTFRKAEHLCLKRDLDAWFAEGKSFVCFPFRITYTFCEKDGAPAKVVVIAQKKRFKRAYQRVELRRLMRESYRVNKHPLVSELINKNMGMHIAFVYVDQKIEPFAFFDKKMKLAINKLNAIVAEKESL